MSEKQLEANRKNGLRGGVKTEEGKEKVRLNALKHGLLSQEVCLENENKEALQELVSNLFLTIQPEGELEKILLDRIVSGVWRLRRMLVIERSIFELKKTLQMHSLTYGDEQVEKAEIRDMLKDDLFERLMRYETTIERGIYRALHELQRLQAARKGQAVNLPIAVDVQGAQE